MSMPPKAGDAKKLKLLKTIKLHKEILFSNTFNENDNSMKVAAWNNILQEAKDLDICTPDRDYTYVRNHVWGQWKSKARRKRENFRNEECQKSSLTDVDRLILEILDLEPQKKEINPTPRNPIINPTEWNGGSRPSEESTFIRKMKLDNRVLEDDMLEYKRLKIELLKLELYAKRLQCLDLERRLGLPNSNWTYDFR